MKLKTVLIGLGRIGFELEFDSKRYHPCTHAGTMKYLFHQFELIGVCDRNHQKIQKFKEWWEYPIFSDTNYTNLLDTLNNIDLLVIATGPDSHLEILTLALKHQIPKILVEKPITYTTKDLEIIRNVAKPDQIYVNFERRYHPYYKKVKEMIDKQIFGNLLFIEGKVLAKSMNRDPLLEDAIHWIDLLLWYIGYPEIIFSEWEIQNNLELRSYHFFKQNDIRIFLESGGRRNYFEFYIRFDFEKGRIFAGNKGIKIFRNALSKRYQKFYELKEIPINISFENPWVNLYNCIYQGINNSNLDNAFLGIKLYEELKKFKNPPEKED